MTHDRPTDLDGRRGLSAPQSDVGAETLWLRASRRGPRTSNLPLRRLTRSAQGFTRPDAHELTNNRVPLVVCRVRGQHCPDGAPLDSLGERQFVGSGTSMTKSFSRSHEQMLWCRCMPIQWAAQILHYLQGLGAGAPTLALNTMYNREVLTSVSDQLFDHDASNLADTMKRACGDAAWRRTASLRGIQIIRDHYQWGTVTESYWRLLASLGSRGSTDLS